MVATPTVGPESPSTAGVEPVPPLGETDPLAVWWLATQSPEVGHSTPGPVELLLLPLFGLLLAGALMGLLAATAVLLARPVTGAGLDPSAATSDVWRQFGLPVGGSVLGTVAVSALGLLAASVPSLGPLENVAVRVLVVGVLLGAVLYRLHFGPEPRRRRRAGRYSYGVFVAVWTALATGYFVSL